MKTQRDGYRAGLLREAIGTDIPKARLLYYFSEREMAAMNVSDGDGGDEPAERRRDSWCGWHNDHSALTGLVLGRFYDGNGETVPDIAGYGVNRTEGGLYVMNREGQRYHLELAEADSARFLAFQIGETSQILSGGVLFATPHSVMTYHGEEYEGVSRASFAVFHQPQGGLSMTAPFHEEVTLEDVQFDRFLPQNVPSSSSRWWNASGDSISDFSTRTFETYYAMKMQ